ncbi:glycosyl transferase family 90-domain-containing protein [Colletotrichum lupini]|nr:glycosyl transferase family 90-domain-containing protein [Colletotrichum lupini]
MRQRKAARRVGPVFVAATLVLVTYVLFYPRERLWNPLTGHHSTAVSFDWKKKAGLATGAASDFEHLHLNEEQCQATFPGLTEEIDLAAAEGEFQLGLGDASASLLGQIKDDRILILQAPRPVDMSDQWIERQSAALHQLHRAILTSPTPLPDTYFNLYIQDTPIKHTWSHSRPARTSSSSSSSPRHTFPIPHFSFWAWTQPFIRSLPHAASAIAEIEASLPFEKKNARAVWRGTSWFNNGASANPRSRQDLIQLTKDAGWADVQALEWTNNGENATNALAIEDFCRYKYIIHTGGVSYSGRLQFQQLCESVVLSPPLEWMQHTTHLVEPVYSSSLLSGGPSELPENASFEAKPRDEQQRHQQRHQLSPRTLEQWPTTLRAEEANMVFVKPDWSDLEATVRWLEDHPDVARGIARRQRALFSGRGYLSPAAEVCYWRALIKGWGRVVRVDDDVGRKSADAVSFEEFIVRAERAKKRGH